MKTSTSHYKAEMNDPMRPKSHARVQFYNGSTLETFADDQIIKIEVVEDVDPISRRLPTETLAFSILDPEGEYDPGNPTGKWESLDRNAQVKVQFGLDVDGETEWLEEDTYYLDGRPSASGGVAYFSASSRLRHLTMTYYKDVYEPLSLAQKIIDVLTDVGMTSSDYDIDPALHSITINTVLPIDTVENLMQIIAHAGSCAVYTKGNKITFKRVDIYDTTTTTTFLNLRDIKKGGDTVSRIEELYRITATKTENEVADEISTIWSGYIDVFGERDIHVEYPPCEQRSITGASHALVYAQAADITVQGEGTVEVTISGKLVKETKTTIEGYATANINGGEDEIDNPIVDSDFLRAQLIYNTAAYLRLRTTHTIDYRGEPAHEVLDKIGFANEYGQDDVGVILCTKITYNGALTGQLIIKSLSQTENPAKLFDNNSVWVLDSDGSGVVLPQINSYVSAYTLDQIDDFITAVL